MTVKTEEKNMHEIFKTGDIVQLKSGGPEMTVKKVDSMSNPPIHCHWFEGKKLEIGFFEPDELVKIESKEKSKG